MLSSSLKFEVYLVAMILVNSYISITFTPYLLCKYYTFIITSLSMIFKFKKYNTMISYYRLKHTEKKKKNLDICECMHPIYLVLFHLRLPHLRTIHTYTTKKHKKTTQRKVRLKCEWFFDKNKKNIYLVSRGCCPENEACGKTASIQRKSFDNI